MALIKITTSSPSIIDQYLIKLGINFTVVSGVLNAEVDKIQAFRLYNIANTEAAKTLVVNCILDSIDDGTNGNQIPTRVFKSIQIPLNQYWSSCAANNLTLTLPPLSMVIKDGETYYIKALNFSGCKIVPSEDDTFDDEEIKELTLGTYQVIQVKADLLNKTWLIY